MQAILFHLEDEDMYQFWYEPMQSFGLDTLLYVDRSTNPYSFPGETTLAFSRFENIREVLKTYPRMQWVFFEPEEDIVQNHKEPVALQDFKHPTDNFIYVFGADRVWDEVWSLNPKNVQYVYIPGHSLRAVNAASMVLWDRRSKE